MYNCLKSLCNGNVRAAIYDGYDDTSRFKFGRLLCVDDTHFALAAISPNGDYDGIIVDEIEDVFRVDACGRYHDKMAKLEQICWDKIEFPDFTQDEIIQSLLRFAQNARRPISFELNNSGVKDVSGFVDGISDRVCKIHSIDEYGYSDGHSYIDMDSITQIEFDSEDEQRIARLYDAQ